MEPVRIVVAMAPLAFRGVIDSARPPLFWHVGAQRAAWHLSDVGVAQLNRGRMGGAAFGDNVSRSAMATAMPTLLCALHKLIRSAQKGQGVVELALILPIALLLGLGAFEVWRAVYSSHTIAQAARDGARLAIDPDTTSSEVVSVVKSAAAPLDVADGDISVVSGTSEVQVSVIYRFTTDVPLISELWGGGSLAIRGEATSRLDEGG